jgi:amidohydrolase
VVSEAEQQTDDVVARIGQLIGELTDELVEIRRDLHAHPELARTEERSTRLVAQRLAAAGLEPHLLPGSGLVADVGPVAVGARRVGLRADLDALPVPDTCGHSFSSTAKGLAHACGHDVHTAAVLGAGLVLARLADEGRLPGGVRLIFQPAEEVHPGGSLDLMAAGALDGVSRVFAVHCEPRLDVGQIGTRIGAITSASDAVHVRLTGPGGHTSRPHVTADLVFALGELITGVPAILGRRLDPRWGVNLTWGAVHAGTVPNAIPASGTLDGTLRCLDVRAWERAATEFEQAVRAVAEPFGVHIEVKAQRGVPPVVNDAECTGLLEQAAHEVVGPSAVVLTEQSLGGEDFAWYLTKVPGAMARLGTRTPGGHTYDLHQGDLDVDERAIGHGAALLARTAVLAAGRPLAVRPTPEISGPSAG